MAKHLIILPAFLAAFFCHGQSDVKVLPADKLIKLIPDKIPGFYLNDDSQSKLIKLGTIRYSVAEKTFGASQHRSIKVLLFDYKDAPIMFSQATRKWSTFTPVESDSVILRPSMMKDCTGWESYNIQQRNSQIMLGICNRFFMIVEGTGVELDFLKSVVQNFKIESYPK